MSEKSSLSSFGVSMASKLIITWRKWSWRYISVNNLAAENEEALSVIGINNRPRLHRNLRHHAATAVHLHASATSGYIIVIGAPRNNQSFVIGGRSSGAHQYFGTSSEIFGHQCLAKKIEMSSASIFTSASASIEIIASYRLRLPIIRSGWLIIGTSAATAYIGGTS